MYQTIPFQAQFPITPTMPNCTHFLYTLDNFPTQLIPKYCTVYNNPLQTSPAHSQHKLFSQNTLPFHIPPFFLTRQPITNSQSHFPNTPTYFQPSLSCSSETTKPHPTLYTSNHCSQPCINQIFCPIPQRWKVDHSHLQ